MSQSAIVLSILFFSIVYLLSFLLIQFHIIKKPLIKKGKLSSLLIPAAAAAVILGIYLYRYSGVLCILLCCAGVFIGVLKASSDILQAKADKHGASPGAQGFRENDPGPASPSGTKNAESSACSLGGSGNGIAYEAQDVKEKVTLNVVCDRRSLFLYPYMILKICFFLFVIVLIFAVIVSAMEVFYDKARPDDIAKFLKIITSFDFGSKALRNLSGARRYPVIAAYGIVVGVISLVLALATGLLLKLHIKRRSVKKAVQPLLPGRKRGFIPCAEGIYKVCYRNLKPGNSFYFLYPWEVLSLYEMQDQKKRIVLKAGKIQMPLIPSGKDSGLYAQLKSAVLHRLQKDMQSRPVKKDRYHWGKAAAAALVILVLQFTFSFLMDSATIKTSGKRECDIAGGIHYSYKQAFSSVGYTYQIYELNGKKIKHVYCELHGTVYMILHPVFHIRSIITLILEKQFAKITGDPILIFDMLAVPSFVWLLLIVIVICAGKPRVFRYNVL